MSTRPSTIELYIKMLFDLQDSDRLYWTKFMIYSKNIFRLKDQKEQIDQIDLKIKTILELFKHDKDITDLHSLEVKMNRVNFYIKIKKPHVLGFQEVVKVPKKQIVSMLLEIYTYVMYEISLLRIRWTQNNLIPPMVQKV